MMYREQEMSATENNFILRRVNTLNAHHLPPNLNKYLHLCKSKTLHASVPMMWVHASILFHAAVNIMRMLGWAWRWWVEYGDNWEPLIEPGQVEAARESVRGCTTVPSRSIWRSITNCGYDKENGDEKRAVGTSVDCSNQHPQPRRISDETGG